MGFNGLTTIDGASDKTLINGLVEAKLASSNREARQFLQSGAVTVNGDKVTDMNFLLSKDNAIEGRFIVLRRGKKLYALVKC